VVTDRYQLRWTTQLPPAVCSLEHSVRQRDLPVQQITKVELIMNLKTAWLLGFNEVSAFTHTFKRWTGKTPSQMRTAAA
jgi:methylphosphotriester-DNA--protein-cysteine methyltransferase